MDLIQYVLHLDVCKIHFAFYPLSHNKNQTKTLIQAVEPVSQPVTSHYRDNAKCWKALVITVIAARRVCQLCFTGQPCPTQK